MKSWEEVLCENNTFEIINRFYICNQDMDGKGPELIGVLDRLPNGELEFKYMLDKCVTFPDYWVKILGFEDLRKTYNTKEIYANLLNWILPQPGTLSDKMFRNSVGASMEDDLWTLLNKYWYYWEGVKPDKYPAHDSHRRYYFYKEIPRLVRRYDI